MHDKIIQIDNKPIKEEDYIDESEFYDHWFIGSIADYVNDVPSSDRRSVIKDVLDRPGLKYDQNKDTLTIVDKRSYFEYKYHEFRKCIEKLSAWSIDEFSSRDPDYTFITLKDMYEDKFGTYLYDTNDCVMYCLDEWVRDSNDGDTIFIGNVIDYHW